MMSQSRVSLAASGDAHSNVDSSLTLGLYKGKKVVVRTYNKSQLTLTKLDLIELKVASMSSCSSPTLFRILIGALGFHFIEFGLLLFADA